MITPGWLSARFKRRLSRISVIRHAYNVENRGYTKLNELYRTVMKIEFIIPQTPSVISHECVSKLTPILLISH